MAYSVGVLSRLPHGSPAAVGLALVLLAPAIAAAHFALLSPPPWRAQDDLGNPQKTGPCGDEGDAAETGLVMSFRAGDTMVLEVEETIFHPGHYRVALATHDRGELPATPAVHPGVSACGSADVMDPPVFPVLADGLLAHATPMPGRSYVAVTLPPDVTCARCTLQVLEFMSSHGAPCFYYHCAEIAIRASAVTPCTTDAECDDANVCTMDRCDATAQRCVQTDPDPTACDDGDQCTLDYCLPTQGCTGLRLNLDHAENGILGTTAVAACRHDDVPAGVVRAFGHATGFVSRAGTHRRRAQRLLRHAARALRLTARRVDRARGGAVSADCGDALAAMVATARARVDCFATSAP